MCQDYGDGLADPSLKTCSRCRAEKPLDQFQLTKARGKPYRRGQCFDCLSRYFREERPDHAERRARTAAKRKPVAVFTVASAGQPCCPQCHDIGRRRLLPDSHPKHPGCLLCEACGFAEPMAKQLTEKG